MAPVAATGPAESPATANTLWLTGGNTTPHRIGIDKGDPGLKGDKRRRHTVQSARGKGHDANDGLFELLLDQGNAAQEFVTDRPQFSWRQPVADESDGNDEPIGLELPRLAQHRSVISLPKQREHFGRLFPGPIRVDHARSEHRPRVEVVNVCLVEPDHPLVSSKISRGLGPAAPRTRTVTTFGFW